MRNRNPDGPWNPEKSVEVSPEEYERQVLDWLRRARGDLNDFEVGHLEKLPGASGEYEFDVVAKFSAFEGAEFVVLVECKRYREAIKRDTVMTLHAKLAEVGAHKAMMFATGGFQKGAIEYASAHGIALLTFIDGRTLYETRGYGPTTEPPPWLDVPRFAAHHLSKTQKGIRAHLVTADDIEIIDQWLEDESEQSTEACDADR